MPEPVEVLVLAPHPDDEVLLAAGVLLRTVGEGRTAAVVVMTNGDFTCERDGYLRQSETITALEALGVGEDQVHFLGYPDGYLSKLGATALAPLERRGPDGACAKGAVTYGHRGWKRVDEHTARTGWPAPYTSESLTEDLAAVLDRLRPRDVYLPHAIDAHPDHASTYVYFRRALDRTHFPAPLVHRGVVHAGPCWPSDCHTPYTPGSLFPPLPEPLERYLPSERLHVDPRLKTQVIALYPSQTGPSLYSDWLSAFARREEIFYPERYVREGERWVRAPPADGGFLATVQLGALDAGASVQLEGCHGSDCDAFDLSVDEKSVTLRRFGHSGNYRLRNWNLPPGPIGPVSLRIDARPDDGDITEWSLFTGEGLLGQAVFAHALKRVARLEPDAGPPDAGAPEAGLDAGPLDAGSSSDGGAGLR